jgi:hypothetical protein
MTESFPRQQARTRRFTLGVPRAFAISPAGDRITFLRTKTGSDPLTCLWLFDVGIGTERLIADPAVLSAAGSGPANRPVASCRTRWTPPCGRPCSAWRAGPSRWTLLPLGLSGPLVLKGLLGLAV